MSFQDSKLSLHSQCLLRRQPGAGTAKTALRACFWAALLVVPASKIATAPDPIGDEIVYTDGCASGNLPRPPVLAAADGYFDMRAELVDDVYLQLQIRRLDDAGNVLGPWTPLADPSLRDWIEPLCDLNPAIGERSDGQFVVAWTRSPSLYAYQSGYGLRSRLFSSSGRPLTGENSLAVIFSSYDEFEIPALEGARDDHFVVAWASNRYGGDGHTMYSGFLSPSGTLLQTAVLAQGGDYSATHPSLARRADDNGFLVVWATDAFGVDDPQPGIDDVDGSKIVGQPLDDVGQPTGDIFQLNVRTVGDQLEPVVVTSEDGFSVSWRNTDPDPEERIERRFDADGAPLSGEVSFPYPVPPNPRFVEVRALPGGGSLTLWEDADQIFAQSREADGSPTSAPIRIDVPIPDSPGLADVWLPKVGEDYPLAFWCRGSDRVSRAIFGGIFRDGFESGDVSRWTP